MPRTGLSQSELRDATLDATETTIRRHGIERTRIVDVARQVGVSHAMLYRVFPDKAALLDAVSQRWLERIDAELAAVAGSADPPQRRLRDWFMALHRLKRMKISADPELYAAFSLAVEKTRPIVIAHLAATAAQIRHIVKDGIDSGAFAAGDPDAIAGRLFEATLSFHHPRLVLERIAEDRETALDELLEFLLRGLLPR